MKTGDIVTGTPLKVNPWAEVPDHVTGRLELAKGEAMGEEWLTAIVHVGDDEMWEVELDSVRLSRRGN